MVHTTDLYARVSAVAHQIEAELKRLGWWQAEPLPREAFQNIGAFGSNTMAFPQWLQFVLLERVKAIVAEQGDFPTDSQVGVYAVRELDGVPEASELTSLLSEFDSLFGDGSYRKTVAGSGGQTLTFTAKPEPKKDIGPPPFAGTEEEKHRWWYAEGGMEQSGGDARIYYGLFGK